MKYIISLAAAFALVFFPFMHITALSYGETEAGLEISSQIDDILAENDLDFDFEDTENMTFRDFTQIIGKSIKTRLNFPFRLLGTVLLTVIAVSVAGSAGENNFSGGTYNTVCLISSVTVIVPQLLTVCENVISALRNMGGFISVFVPVFAGISVICGGFSSVGAYHAALLMGSEVLIRLSESFLLPVAGIITALGISGSVFSSSSSMQISDMLRKAVTWAVTVSMGLFTGFVSLKCVTAGRADSFAAKTVKFVISGAVPLVGSAVSDAYSAVKGSFGVIHSAAGFAGIISAAAILLPPIAEVAAYRAVLRAGTAAAELFSADMLTKIFKVFDSGLAIALSLLVSYGAMFVLCSAALLSSFQGG